MRYRLQRHDGTDCSATMVPFTVLRMVPIQRYRHISVQRFSGKDKTTVSANEEDKCLMISVTDSKLLKKGTESTS